MNSSTNFSDVEKVFLSEFHWKASSSKVPTVIVDNFPKLGLLTSLRFLEWVAENPNGVISLPTGKTPEYFIKWTQHILKNWEAEDVIKLRNRYNLDKINKPSLKNLRFVQIDEFYPINSSQHNSFYYYVRNWYIEGLGLDPNNALLINCNEIPLPNNKTFNEIFPDFFVDLSLRYRECKNAKEIEQREAIFMIDDWCSEYEKKIREWGGIGFFLGGIGPDGHIAFNTRGSDFYSTTRLTETNFETQAVAASDLGGIEVSSKRLVITIGLGTITYNKDSVAIIIASGESKADIVQQSLENEIQNYYPATCLQTLKNSRFYITEGAACRLKDALDFYFKSGEWTYAKSEKAVIDLCKKINKYGHHLILEDFLDDEYCRLIPNLSEKVVEEVINRIQEKINRGIQKLSGLTFLHTGPHHDDIMLGIYPFIAEHLHDSKNKFHFSVFTSGFNAVTNSFIIEVLENTIEFLANNEIQMINYPDFFESGYKYKWDKDIYHCITNIAAKDTHQIRRGLCHRIVRALTLIFDINNINQLNETILEVLTTLGNSYDGEKNPPNIQKLKGMIREFEEELVWAHFGVQVKNIEHARLGFYKGDIFTELPEKNRDVAPILKMLKKVNPNVISLAFDPEGSGPDTHYKVLQAIAEALREWQKTDDISNIKIWGYRNVWYRFQPHDANIIVPVSLGAMASMESVFANCYQSQVNASFPSFELNGKFSELSQKIWVEQLKSLQLLLGKDFFYQNENPKLRSCHGCIFLKEMSINEFLKHARELEKSTEGKHL